MIKLSNKLKKSLKEVLLYAALPIITGVFLYLFSSYLYEHYRWSAKKIFAIFSVIVGLSSIFWLAVGQLLSDFIKFAISKAKRIKLKNIIRRKNVRPG